MAADSYVLFFGIMLAGLLLAGGIYRTLAVVLTQPVPRERPEDSGPDQHQPVFLFDGQYLVDATSSAAELVTNRPDEQSEFDALIKLLQRQFPTVLDDIADLTDDTKSKVLTSDNLGLTISLEKRQGLTRISLGGSETQDHTRFTEIERAAQLEELALLRNLTENAPQMIWQENSDGELLWANSAYLTCGDKLANAAGKAETVWPDDRIFPDLPAPSPGSLSPTLHRKSIKLPDETGENWYDITCIPQAGGVLNYAVNANEAVRAELAKRDFQQTLAKTFAQLATGLAIFDRDRKLTMFNPALLDLTELPVEFLSSRPSIQMVMDRLRDGGRLPEPKNYASWREQFCELENAAENGSYCENWDLLDGQTYRVTGRPHPDGALAFLFEDISAEVLLTRRFRTEIETGQSVLDTLPDAIAVFSNAGTLVMSNSSYEEMWGMTDSDAVTSRNLRNSIRVWKAFCVASRVWSELEEVTTCTGDRDAWSDAISLNDGRNAVCYAIPLAGGMTMVKFVVTAAAAPSVRKLSIGDPVPRVAKS